MPSTDEIVIYHNPRCSKSRATLDLLRANGIEPRVVEYLKTPPSQAEMEQILDALGMEPRDLMRQHEVEYEQAALDDPGLTRSTLILAMLQRPKLIERPIVVRGRRAAIGRPPENVLEILA
ncbi:arsenate reductase (glutaredoxin) [Acidihalobacter ferrooxydans]|uniref:Arsenate reductase n=1 Tax=Acidihalobacter ferrooxydans TaxID=1765967 RepID=A0A1P8UJF8_9GAMM|nr:arsenate reductase (glutaredoxin) [Acidihalobacter ferrooxydans]APZ43921.1 arsenate reductase (glutaredoxin) [Acidihalobacter ferrooxydans]